MAPRAALLDLLVSLGVALTCRIVPYCMDRPGRSLGLGPTFCAAAPCAALLDLAVLFGVALACWTALCLYCFERLGCFTWLRADLLCCGALCCFA